MTPIVIPLSQNINSIPGVNPTNAPVTFNIDAMIRALLNFQQNQGKAQPAKPQTKSQAPVKPVVPVSKKPVPAQPKPVAKVATPLLVPVVNAKGIVVNPNRFAGPLAHTEPAGFGIRTANNPVGFTPEVAAARQALLAAHRNILAQQSALVSKSKPQQ